MLVTTSRNCSLEVKQYALSFSNKKKAKYLNRGKKTIEEIVQIARKFGNTKIAVIRSKKKIDYIMLHHANNWDWI